MVLHCCAYNCKNVVGIKNLSFHRFPQKDPVLLKKWLKNLRWKDWKPGPTSKVCSEHFEKKCFVKGGKKKRIHPWAVPTIFSFPNSFEKRKSKINPRSRRALGVLEDLEASEQTNSKEQETADSKKYTRELETDDWHILGNEGLSRSVTVSRFFHSGYCLPNHIHWSGDDDVNLKPNVVYGVLAQAKPHVIEVKGRWEWLGLDIRGPFSPTVNNHTHIMTLMDYHTKWVEAFPVTHNLIQDVTRALAEVIRQQGFPFAVLSRLPRKDLLEINSELKTLLGLSINPLVIHHRQTGYMDLTSEALLNEMLEELVKKHSDAWDIHLPVAVMRLCCTDHPTTKESPFSRMCASDPPFSLDARELPFSATEIRLSSFVILNESNNLTDAS